MILDLQFGLLDPSEETIQIIITIRENIMRKLFDIFKVLQFQKRIVAEATTYISKYGILIFDLFNPDIDK